MTIPITVGDVVTRVRQRIQGARRGAWNRLASSIDDTITSLTLTRAAAPIKKGSFIAIGTEKMYVTDVTGLDVDVERGFDTTAASHTAGDVVEINWRQFTYELLDMFDDEIRSWPDTVFAVGQQEVSIGITSRSVDLPLTRFRHPLQLRRKVSTGEWTNVPIRRYRIEQGLPTSDFPSGNALIVTVNPDSATYRLDYARSFNLALLGDLTANLTDIGITNHLIDAGQYGVMARALEADEANRSSTSGQPEPREAVEVEAGDRVRTAIYYWSRRNERLDDEVRRLHQTYPVKI